jgi:hypothetical protein
MTRDKELLDDLFYMGFFDEFVLAVMAGNECGWLKQKSAIFKHYADQFDLLCVQALYSKDDSELTTAIELKRELIRLSNRERDLENAPKKRGRPFAKQS